MPDQRGISARAIPEFHRFSHLKQPLISSSSPSISRKKESSESRVRESLWYPGEKPHLRPIPAPDPSPIPSEIFRKPSSFLSSKPNPLQAFIHLPITPPTSPNSQPSSLDLPLPFHRIKLPLITRHPTCKPKTTHHTISLTTARSFLPDFTQQFT